MTVVVVASVGASTSAVDPVPAVSGGAVVVVST
jgi:hypothetical protein